MNPDQQSPERVRGFPVEIDVEEEEKMQVRTFLMMMIVTVDMFPLHLQSQIRDPIGSKRQRDPGM